MVERKSAHGHRLGCAPAGHQGKSPLIMLLEEVVGHLRNGLIRDHQQYSRGKCPPGPSVMRQNQGNGECHA